MQKLLTIFVTLFLISCNSLVDTENFVSVKSDLSKKHFEENSKKEISGNDLSKDNLFGEVESVHTVYYEANSKFGKDEKGNKISETIVLYNEKGNKFKEEFYDQNDVLEKRIPINIICLFYE